MAILFHDGFDHYGAGAISGAVSQSGGFAASGYETVGQVITLNESYARYTAARTGAAVSLGAMLNTANAPAGIWIKRAVPEWTDKLVFGFAFKFFSAQVFEVQIFEFNADLQISILPNLQVKAFGQNANFVLEPNIYYFFEVQIDKSGNATLWISENQVATATGRSAVIAHWHIMAKASTAMSSLVYVDDVYLLDGSGTTNTSRLGRTNSIFRIPTATVEAGFSVSSGTAFNHTYVNKITPTGDTSYVKESKNAVRDLYGNATAVQTTKDIKAVSVVTSSRREENDDFKITPIMKSGATVKEGTPYSLATYNYTGDSQVFEVDPATSLKWTVAGLQAASWGQKLTAPVIT